MYCQNTDYGLKRFRRRPYVREWNVTKTTYSIFLKYTLQPFYAAHYSYINNKLHFYIFVIFLLFFSCSSALLYFCLCGVYRLRTILICRFIEIIIVSCSYLYNNVIILRSVNDVVPPMARIPRKVVLFKIVLYFNRSFSTLALTPHLLCCTSARYIYLKFWNWLIV